MQKLSDSCICLLFLDVLDDVILIRFEIRLDDNQSLIKPNYPTGWFESMLWFR